MILCVDIGNTNIVLGCYDGEKLVMFSRISTDRSRMGDQYAVELKDILTLYDILPDSVDGAIISSVVPSLTEPMASAVTRAVGVKPKILKKALYKDLIISLDNPSEIGDDLVVAAVAAKKKYTMPAILIDMGTATTITALDKDGVFLGGAILPGVRVATDAIIARTSTLVGISLEAPDNVIGKSTVDCMKSGAIFGTASMLDGMCERMSSELGGSVTVVATGGLAKVVEPYCKTDIILDDMLLMEGLKLIYETNE